MKQFFFFYCFLLCNLSFSQYIKGTVVDAFNQPLPRANVYYEGTTLSTLTNDKGEFILVYESKLNRPIVVSYIGYSTVYVEDYSLGVDLLIELSVEVNSLKEVVVKKDRFSRKEKMAIFKEHFLGTTPFGQKAIIQNESDIVFDYDESSFILRAYADKPLIIINPSLGYKINYELVDFEIQFTSLTVHPHAVFRSYYAGLSQYEEIENTPKILKKRKEAYRGSTLHFFRNLIHGVWGKDEFTLFVNGNMTNPENHFTITNEGDKFKVAIKRQKLESVNNKTDTVAFFSLLFDNKYTSAVQFNADTIYVDPFGNNLSLRAITFSGAIQQKRIGDTLPLNYGL